MNRRVPFLIFASLGLSVTGANAQEIFADNDRTWISISGTVEEVNEHSFRLDYGEDDIGVEMDDWAWYREAFTLLEGDDVTVSGYIDDDFFTNTSMEATAIFVDGLNSYFYASGGDDAQASFVSWVPTVETVINGTVTNVGDEEFEVDTGERMLTVSVDELGYDPFDQEGMRQVETGDRVAVTGDMEDTFFEEREFVADTVTILTQDTQKQMQRMRQQQDGGDTQQQRGTNTQQRTGDRQATGN